MNRPDKAGEPSMEEILASIRQIIADEPSTETSEPPIEANPLVPSQSSKPVEPRGPLADRLSGVLKNGSLPPTGPLGSKRPLSFDQDLADMFDEEVPANGSSAAAPKPDIRVPAALSHPMSAKSFVPPVAPKAPEQDADKLVKEERATPASISDGAAALPSQPAPSEPLIPPPPFGGSSAEKPADVAPPTTFGFPPLRKTSFYPPQPKAPVTPSPVVSAPPQSAEPAPQPISPVSAPSDAQDVLRALGGFGSGVSGAEGGVSAPSSQPFGTSHDAPRFNTPEAPFSPFGTSAPASSASSSPALETPVEPPFGGRAYGSAPESPIDVAPVSSAAARPVEARPMEPRSYPDPFAQTVRPNSGYGAQPRFATEHPRMSSDAAHQALDALAQGLAASAAASSMPAEPVSSPAVPLTPVFEALEPEVSVPPSPSMLPATIPSQGSMPVNRTLEDAVADMLRPMLQQWVAENMPRIIERALRTEVAQSVKPGNKPPGT